MLWWLYGGHQLTLVTCCRLDLCPSELSCFKACTGTQRDTHVIVCTASLNRHRHTQEASCLSFVTCFVLSCPVLHVSTHLQGDVGANAVCQDDERGSAGRRQLPQQLRFVLDLAPKAPHGAPADVLSIMADV